MIRHPTLYKPLKLFNVKIVKLYCKKPFETMSESNTGQIIKRQTPDQSNALTISDSSGTLIQTVRTDLYWSIIFQKISFDFR